MLACPSLTYSRRTLELEECSVCFGFREGGWVAMETVHVLYWSQISNTCVCIFTCDCTEVS